MKTAVFSLLFQKICVWESSDLTVISGVNRDELEAKEKIILPEIEANPNLTTRQLSETLNIPFRSVQRYISNLREKGFIDRVGANKNNP